MRYRLDDLGWFQFEELVQSLIKEKFGVGIQSWGGHNDLGRDAYFERCIELSKNSILKGPIVFQVKFIENANSAGAKPGKALLNAVRTELKKIKTDGKWKSFKSYILITNVTLSKTLREKVNSFWVDKFADKIFYTFGGKDLCDWLDGVPSIKYAFPLILGLADLGYLIEDAIIKSTKKRTRILLEQAYEIAKLFVPTKAYINAIRILHETHFIVLEGPPEVGKTTLGQIILLEKATEGYESYELRKPEEFFKVYKANRNQIYFSDDAFGSTEYDPYLTKRWAEDLDKIIFKLDRGHLFIWVTRSHILKIALNTVNLKAGAETFPEAGDIIINVKDLSLYEKAKMLYNHAKYCRLEDLAKQIVKEYAEFIIKNQNFTPFRIYRFVHNKLPDLAKLFNSINADDLKNIIDEEIRTPTKQMEITFRRLSSSHQRLLFSMLNYDRKLIYRKGLEEIYNLYSTEKSFIPFDQVLEELCDSFINVYGSTLECIICFIHPSLRGFVINELSRNKRERILFLKKCSVSGIRLTFSGGGEKGEIYLPLLKDEEDWQIINTRIEEIISEASESEIDSMLLTIEEIGKRDRKKKEIHNLLEASLKGVLEKYKDGSSVISDKILESYYRLSAYLYKNPTYPYLEYSYQYFLSEIEKSKEDSKHLFLFINCMDLVIFIAIIQKYEPSFFDQYRKSFKKNITEILKYLRDPLHFYIYGDPEDDIGYFLGIIEDLEDLLDIFLEIKDNINEVIGDLEGQIYSLEGEIERGDEEYDYEYDYDFSAMESDYISHKETRSVSIKEIFEDL